MPGLINLLGQKYGKLTVVEDLGSKNGKHWWRCECECGGEKITHSTSLRTGNVKSCGCLKTKGLLEYNQKQSEKNKIPIGTRFGKLVVIEDLGFLPHVEGHNRRSYKCKCDCGKECIASGNQLKTNNKKSCGHCIVSISEYNIQLLLEKYNFNFQHDVSLPELTKECGQHLRFDFIIYDNDNKIKRIIEFDGRQHVVGPDTTYWGRTTDTLETIQQKDEIKNNFCKKHNIPLVRIPYWKRDTITLKDLTEDKYLI